MAFWVNLCVILTASAIQQRRCQHSSDISYSLKSSKGAVLPVIHTDSAVNTSDRHMRSRSRHTNQVADVMMIMDISTSLSRQDQEYQRQALRGLSKSKVINIGKDSVRMGIVAFETKAHLILPLDKGISRKAIYNAAVQVGLSRIKEDDRRHTNFPDAMNMAKEQLANARKDAVKVAILVADGGEDCAPSQVFLVKPCSKTRDCHAIAKNCTRPPPGKDLCNCKKYKSLTCNMRSAVFGEFEELKKAGGWQVTLAIIGVGLKITQYGRDRLNCWATERMYKEVSSYSQLEKMIVGLVTTVLPMDPHYDCNYTSYTNESCQLDKHNKCGHYVYINITQNRTGNGRPCPEKKSWKTCANSQCGVTFGPGDYTPVPENDADDERKHNTTNTTIAIVVVVVIIVIVTIALVVAIVWNRKSRRNQSNQRAIPTQQPARKLKTTLGASRTEFLTMSTSMARHD